MTRADRARLGRPAESPTRVLYVDNTSTFGGAINSLLHLLCGLDRTRYSPILVTGQPETLVRTQAAAVPYERIQPKLPWVHDRVYRRIRSLPPFRVRTMALGLARLRTLGWLLSVTLPDALRYRSVGRRHDARLVHLNNNVETQLAGILAARMLGVPCIAHARCFQHDERAVRLYAALADHHIAISSAIRDNLLELGVEPDRVSVVFDGIDLARFRDAGDRRERLRRELGLPGGAPLFGIFGRIIPWKGVREFVLAAHHVLGEHPSARALIVGDGSDGGDAYREEVVRLIHERGLDGRIVLTGYRPDVPDLMDLVDVVVHASVVPEPFGMVLIEAMAAGTPVVATRAGGPLDIVRDGETGLLVECGEPAALARAILPLLRSPERARAMGRRGKARAQAVFGNGRYADEVQAVYDAVLGRTRRRRGLRSV